MQLLAEDGFGIRRLEGGKNGIHFLKSSRENAYTKQNLYITKFKEHKRIALGDTWINRIYCRSPAQLLQREVVLHDSSKVF